ncbi:MAG: hypothetical protein AAFW95_10120 [Cyanobacteria bacterium J06638_6]
MLTTLILVAIAVFIGGGLLGHKLDDFARYIGDTGFFNAQQGDWAAEDRTPASVLAFIASTPKAGKATHSRQPITAVGVALELLLPLRA